MREFWADIGADLRAVLAAIWAEMRQPSGPAETPYQAALIAMAHAMLGAALIGPLMLLLHPVTAVALVGVGYFILKERADLRRGGSWVDSLRDTVHVMMGIGYGQIWWPALVLVIGLLAAMAQPAATRSNPPANPPEKGA